MKNSVLKYCFLVFIFMLIQNLSAKELRPYFQFGGVIGKGSVKGEGKQSMSKEVATCPNQLCTGDTTSTKFDKGNMGNGYSLELGGEYFFDKYEIVGIRLFGEYTKSSIDLGESVSNSRDTSTNNLAQAAQICKDKGGDANMCGNAGILIIKPGTTVVNDYFTFAQTADMKMKLPQDANFTTLGLGGDVFVNIPLDHLFRRFVKLDLDFDYFDGSLPKKELLKAWLMRELYFFKLGLFLGGGYEFAQTKNTKSWYNAGSSRNDDLFSTGSGMFLRYGLSIYVTRFARINIGYKHGFYNIEQERWFAVDGLSYNGAPGDVRVDDPWSETLLRQKIILNRGKEFFINVAISI